MNREIITGITADHYADILRINQDNVEMLSPLDEKGLAELLQKAALARAAVTDGHVAAFVIALREGTDYQSVNYRWFGSRLDRFLYIDRIAVAQEYRGRGLGSQLYSEVLAFARSTGAATLAAEINVEPENRPSLAFHRSFGFAEVGRQTIDGGKKTVSMQTRTL